MSSLRHVHFASAIHLAPPTRRPVFSFQSRPDGAHGTNGNRFAPASLNDEALAFVEWLLKQANVDFASYRECTFARRLPACLRELRAASLEEARQRIAEDPSRLDAAVSALLLGVTSFFRDRAVFDVLRDTVLPRILGQHLYPRIWSAGCSNGAELFSLAMLIEDHGALNRCDLLGTDVRPGAIRQASEGRFNDVDLRDLPEMLVQRHFVKCESRNHRAHRPRESAGSGMRETQSVRMVRRSLRRLIRFRRADILNAIEHGPWDLIVCRNMAMYMNSSTAATLWRQLESALRPGGFLVLGTAERPIGAHHLEPFSPCIYHRPSLSSSSNNGSRWSSGSFATRRVAGAMVSTFPSAQFEVSDRSSVSSNDQ